MSKCVTGVIANGSLALRVELKVKLVLAKGLDTEE